MSAIDEYGEFEVPEEKSVVEVVEDPVRVVSSCYDLFKKATEKIRSSPDWFFGNGKDEIYSLAEKLFEGREKLRITSEQLSPLLEEKMDSFDATGLFLSALQNRTNTDVLAVYPNKNFDKIMFDFVGYKLNKHKTFVIGYNVALNSIILGKEQTGNIISYAGGLAFINTTFDMKIYLETWFSSKTSPVLKAINLSKYSGIILNDEVIPSRNYAGKLVCLHLNKSRGYNTFDIGNDPDFRPLKSELEQKLKEIDFFNQTRVSREKIFEQIEAYDWQSFAQKIRSIGEQIKEGCRKVEKRNEQAR